MTISRRAALRSSVLAWPLLLCAPAAAAARPLPHPKYFQLSPLGQAICSSIVERRSARKWAWMEPKERVLKGWTGAQIDRLQVACGRWELAQQDRLVRLLYRLGL